MPGLHVIKYTAADSNGNRGTAFLNIYVERQSSARLSYVFVPPDRTSQTAVEGYTAQLRNNATMRNEVIVKGHLSAFGIAANYEPYASPPKLLRAASVDLRKANPEPGNSGSGGQSVFVVRIEVEVVLVSVVCGRALLAIGAYA